MQTMRMVAVPCWLASPPVCPLCSSRPSPFECFSDGGVNLHPKLLLQLPRVLWKVDFRYVHPHGPRPVTSCELPVSSGVLPCPRRHGIKSPATEVLVGML